MRGFLHGETEYDLYHTNGLWQDVNHATAAIARAKGKPCVISRMACFIRKPFCAAGGKNA